MFLRHMKKVGCIYNSLEKIKRFLMQKSPDLPLTEHDIQNLKDAFNEALKNAEYLDGQVRDDKNHVKDLSGLFLEELSSGLGKLSALPMEGEDHLKPCYEDFVRIVISCFLLNPEYANQYSDILKWILNLHGQDEHRVPLILNTIFFIAENLHKDHTDCSVLFAKIVSLSSANQKEKIIQYLHQDISNQRQRCSIIRPKLSRLFIDGPLIGEILGADDEINFPIKIESVTEQDFSYLARNASAIKTSLSSVSLWLIKENPWLDEATRGSTICGPYFVEEQKRYHQALGKAYSYLMLLLPTYFHYNLNLGMGLDVTEFNEVLIKTCSYINDYVVKQRLSFSINEATAMMKDNAGDWQNQEIASVQKRLLSEQFCDIALSLLNYRCCGPARIEEVDWWVAKILSNISICDVSNQLKNFILPELIQLRQKDKNFLYMITFVARYYSLPEDSLLQAAVNTGSNKISVFFNRPTKAKKLLDLLPLPLDADRFCSINEEFDFISFCEHRKDWEQSLRGGLNLPIAEVHVKHPAGQR